MSLRLGFLLALATSVLVLARPAAPVPQEPSQSIVLTHGVASGDVTTSSAVIWARSSGPTKVHVEFDTNSTFAHPKSGGSVHTSEATDFTAQLTLDHLRPATRYWYRVWLKGDHDQRREHLFPGEQDESDEQEGAEDHEHGRGHSRESLVGTFITAPEAWQSRPVSFVLGADVGGQKYCRNAAKGGYAIFGQMQALAPDFYIANGDSIYADGDCPLAGGEAGWVNIPGDFPGIGDPSVDWTDTAAVRDVFLKHWRYNRADPFTQGFFRSTSMIAQWDDHEVINDFGAPWTYWNSANINRAGYPNIVAAGLDTFFAYSPIARQPADPARIYRSFRWGRDVELFVLDARSYRDRNDTLDTATDYKVMLGKEQLAWLVDEIQRSTATWKIVASDVPISIPTGSLTFGRDAWGRLEGEPPTGFRRELLHLLSELDRVNAENVVFVATDVHYAQNIAYAVDADGDGEQLQFHEIVRGPLNAVKNPPKTTLQLDPSAHPESLYSEGNFFNFGYVTIGKQADGKIHFIADARGEDGRQRPLSVLDLTPQ